MVEYKLVPARLTINFMLRCVLSIHLVMGAMLVAAGFYPLRLAHVELQQMAQAAAEELSFVVPGDYRLSGSAVMLLTGVAKISAVSAFWLPVGMALDVLATVGLLLMFLVVTHVHGLTGQPVAPPLLMAALALLKLVTTPAARLKPRKALV